MPLTFRRLAAALACSLLAATTASAQAPAGPPTKVSVSILFITADVGIFYGIEKGYYKEQGLELDLQRMTSAADAIALLATDKLDVGSGSATPGLFNALKRGLPIQIVAEKSSVRPIGPDNNTSGSGSLLVRTDLREGGQVKTMADLKGKRIAVNNLQSTTLNYVMRGIARGGLGKDDVTFVEMPFNQFVPALEKKAVDAVMAYPPLVQTIEGKMKLAVSMPESELHRTSANDATNIMMFSPAFARSDAAKRFMVAHLKAQREYMRLVVAGQPGEVCRAINKYTPAMPADCAGMSFTGVDPNGAINVESLERYQNEWLQWGVMKDAADIRKNVNLEFARNAVTVLGPAR
ncbi:MAG: NMT1/THI5-like protein [Ramlibacter sp.]|jgi:NitT/TauT family transport system substrate-binding protein|nr:NMT1/THI5-like protein [Ramlibacter sp.]